MTQTAEQRKPLYTPPPRYWTGRAPKACDICEKPIGTVFTDGKTRRGPWAIMCPDCLPRMSIARTTFHGTGLGQEYTKQADGKWMKTAG